MKTYFFYFYGINAPYPFKDRYKSDKAAKIAFKAACRRAGIPYSGYIDIYSHYPTKRERLVEY